MIRENKGLIIIESDDYRVIIDPRSQVEWGLLGKGTNTFDAKVCIARLSDGPRPEVVLELEEDDLTTLRPSAPTNRRVRSWGV